MTIKWIKWNKCEIHKNSRIWVHRTDIRQQPFWSRQKAEIHKQILNKTWRWWQATRMAPHPIPLPCALAFPPPSHRDATTPSPSWAPHFMNRERILFSNPTSSKPRLSPAATMSNDMLSTPTLPLHCASILQSATPPQVFVFKSKTISAPICLNRFTFAESRNSNVWSCVCVFLHFPLLPLLFW